MINILFGSFMNSYNRLFRGRVDALEGLAINAFGKFAADESEAEKDQWRLLSEASGKWCGVNVGVTGNGSNLA